MLCSSPATSASSQDPKSASQIFLPGAASARRPARAGPPSVAAAHTARRRRWGVAPVLLVRSGRRCPFRRGSARLGVPLSQAVGLNPLCPVSRSLGVVVVEGMHGEIRAGGRRLPAVTPAGAASHHGGAVLPPPPSRWTWGWGEISTGSSGHDRGGALTPLLHVDGAVCIPFMSVW